MQLSLSIIRLSLSGSVFQAMILLHLLFRHFGFICSKVSIGPLVDGIFCLQKFEFSTSGLTCDIGSFLVLSLRLVGMFGNYILFE